MKFLAAEVPALQSSMASKIALLVAGVYFFVQMQGSPKRRRFDMPPAVFVSRSSLWELSSEHWESLWRHTIGNRAGADTGVLRPRFQLRASDHVMIFFRTAYSTISAVLCRFSFCIILLRCVSIVVTLRFRAFAISLFDLPSAISCSTSRSRPESRS